MEDRLSKQSFPIVLMWSSGLCFDSHLFFTVICLLSWGRNRKGMTKADPRAHPHCGPCPSLVVPRCSSHWYQARSHSSALIRYTGKLVQRYAWGSTQEGQRLVLVSLAAFSRQKPDKGGHTSRATLCDNTAVAGSFPSRSLSSPCLKRV